MHTNKLAQEKSPYLLQHQHNPVNWYPWGDEAFSLARAQNKPIFLSIGYSTCYWCHVMEKDSFETEEVAAVLNTHFISIKVDREERPDVDSIYMNAVVALSGHGGWPLSAFLTPDLKPFYGGTFFRQSHFIALLEKISSLWLEQADAVHRTAEQLTSHIRDNLSAAATLQNSEALTEQPLRSALQDLKRRFDSNYGGFSQAPKFPPSMTLRLLFRLKQRFQSEEALQMATLTMQKMARGGLFDQLGHGFHRYSTDERWLVPHFEKMLYDNALLSVAYLEAFQITGEKFYADVVEKTLNYVLREMTDPEGGFYSAQDAGEVGTEGEFYVWEAKELSSLLSPDEFSLLSRVYEISDAGNFEHSKIILAERDTVSPETLSIQEESQLQTIQQKLFQTRKKRKAPHKDDKILTSWNALMISAFALASRTLQNEEFLSAAEHAAHFLEKNLFSHDTLLRRYRDGEARFAAYLDDYVFFIEALLHLFETDFDSHWLSLAEKLQGDIDSLFWDDESGGYYFSRPDDAEIIARQKDFTDNAEPSGNSIALQNLLRLAILTRKQSYQERAEKLFNISKVAAERYPSAFASYLLALDFYLSRPAEVIVIADELSPEVREFFLKIHQQFLPHLVCAFSSNSQKSNNSPLLLAEGKIAHGKDATYFICEKGSCKLPTTDAGKALTLLKEISQRS